MRRLLTSLGVLSYATTELYATRTRDNQNLLVYRDTQSGVIFIDDFYVGDMTYRTGEWHTAPLPAGGTPKGSDEVGDVPRRLATARPFIRGRRVCDFGCGSGDFMRAAIGIASGVEGVELEETARLTLKREGFQVSDSLDGLDGPFDVVTMFHVLEHLPSPVAELNEIRNRLVPEGKGTIIVEVPHACDALLSIFECEGFRDFTLWSQHLVLHTRESLSRLLKACGFRNIKIIGVQRYNLANHITWLRYGRAGGHRSALSALVTRELAQAYENSLVRLDATDTLLAIASS